MNANAEVMRNCIKACLECYTVCLQTIHHCLKQGGKHAAPEHISILQDCAEICQLTINYLIRGSEFSMELSELCAEICERCAEDCESIDKDDEQMTRCAEICRNCAAACRKMA